MRVSLRKMERAERRADVRETKVRLLFYLELWNCAVPSRLLHISLQCRCRQTSRRALVGSHFIRNEFNFLKDAGKSMFVFVQFQSLNEYFMKIR